MKKTGIFYATNLGAAATVAKQIGEKLNVTDIYDVRIVPISKMMSFDSLVLVVSTHFEGDIQRDFAAHLDDFRRLDLSGKTVAVVGLGDGMDHGHTFNNALGKIYDLAIEQGATCVGSSEVDTYDYEETLSLRDGRFPGLALDIPNQDDLTQTRIEQWVEQVKEHLV